jgi:hypothetical protein
MRPVRGVGGTRVGRSVNRSVVATSDSVPNSSLQAIKLVGVESAVVVSIEVISDAVTAGVVSVSNGISQCITLGVVKSAIAVDIESVEDCVTNAGKSVTSVGANLVALSLVESAIIVCVVSVAASVVAGVAAGTECVNQRDTLVAAQVAAMVGIESEPGQAESVMTAAIHQLAKVRAVFTTVRKVVAKTLTLFVGEVSVVVTVISIQDAGAPGQPVARAKVFAAIAVG